MRAIVQRVTEARVTIDDVIVGQIGPGFCILLGAGPDDTADTARHLAARVATLRICSDDAGKMNRDLMQTGGAALVVSQFTLYADTSRGHRPSFVKAGPPQAAADMCDQFIQELVQHGIPVECGDFGAHMMVELINDGPVTIALTSGEGDWPADAG